MVQVIQLVDLGFGWVPRSLYSLNGFEKTMHGQNEQMGIPHNISTDPCISTWWHVSETNSAFFRTLAFFIRCLSVVKSWLGMPLSVLLSAPLSVTVWRSVMCVRPNSLMCDCSKSITRCTLTPTGVTSAENASSRWALIQVLTCISTNLVIMSVIHSCVMASWLASATTWC